MKKVILSFALTAGAVVANAQSIGINTTPTATAALDISSTTKGLLVPRMSTTQRNNIATANSTTAPATGLMVYDNTVNAFFYYNGSAWTQVGASAAPALTFTSVIAGSNGNGNGTFYVGQSGFSASEQDNHRILASSASTVKLFAAASGPLTSSYTLTLRKGTPSGGAYAYSDLSSTSVTLSGATAQTITVTGLSLVAGETLSVKVVGTSSVSANGGKALYFSITAQ
jgi:hypothetical protein